MPKRVKIKPMPISEAQRQFRELDVWLRGYTGGRGAGKTRIGTVDIQRRVKPRDRWLVVSPDNNMIRETTLPTFEEVGEFTNQLLDLVTSPIPKATIRTPYGGVATVVFRGAEKPDKLRGGNYSGIWFDEASIISEDAFNYGIATCRRGGKMGPCLATFTPRGFKHWTFQKFFERIRDDQVAEFGERVRFFQNRPYIARSNTGLVHCRTRDNPFLPQEFEQTIGGNYSSVLAAQELGGEYIEISGQIFRREWFRLVDEVPLDCQRVRYWDKAACLIESTPVTTSRGVVDIASVQVGDSVLTRNGWRRVTKSWLSKYTNQLVSVIFSNGSIITGTSDHLIWTKNRYWVELGSLDSGDIVLGESEVCQRPTITCRTSSTTVGDTPRSLDGDTSKQWCGTGSVSDTSLTRSTVQSGGMRTEIYPMAIMSTIATETRITTTSVILNASHRKSTSRTIRTLTSRELRSLIQSSEQKHKQAFEGGSQKTKTRQHSRNRQESGATASGEIGHTKSTSVSNAAFSLNQEVLSSQNSAVLTALQNSPRQTGECVLRERRPRPANVAGRSSKATGESRHVVTHVGKFSGVPVYDLSVAGQHEFFADGILVHNSADSGCFTVGLLMAKDRRGVCYIEDVVRGQWSYHERNEIMLQTARRDMLRYGGTVLTYIEQEGGGDGKVVMDQLLVMLAAFPVYRDIVSGGGAWKTQGNVRLPGDAKIRRALPFAGQAEAGNVRVLDASWTSEYLEELTMFPEYAFADQVDASSGSFNKLAGVVPDHLYAERSIADVSVDHYGETVALSKPSTMRWEDLPWNHNTGLSGETME